MEGSATQMVQLLARHTEELGQILWIVLADAYRQVAKKSPQSFLKEARIVSLSLEKSRLPYRDT